MELLIKAFIPMPKFEWQTWGVWGSVHFAIANAEVFLLAKPSQDVFLLPHIS